MSNRDSNLVKQKKNKKFFKDSNFSRLAIILVILIAIFTACKPREFFSIGNFQAMSYQFPEFGLMALGVMLTMIAGGIDLSVVGMANLSSIMTAVTMVNLSGTIGIFPAIIVSIIVGLLVGVVCGTFNGVLVSALGVPAMLATLGAQQLYTGIGLVITKGSGISRLPTEFALMGRTQIFGIVPVSVLLFAVIVAIIAFKVNKTRFGSELYLVGSNSVASRFSGISNIKVLTKAHMMSGLLSSVAGIVMLANYNSAKPDYGTAYTLQTILISVLGGVSPNGGFGKVGGVVLAVLILQVSSSGLNMFSSISNFYRQLIWGAVLLLVLSLNYLRNYFEERKVAKVSK